MICETTSCVVDKDTRVKSLLPPVNKTVEIWIIVSPAVKPQEKELV
jgi:hypothetical protein